MQSMTCYHWVCCYDIRDPKRLARVHKTLCMLGIALNYSVFYLYISHAQYEQLCCSLTKLIRPEDDVRLYIAAPLQSAQYIGEMMLEGVKLMHAKGILL